MAKRLDLVIIGLIATGAVGLDGLEVPCVAPDGTPLPHARDCQNNLTDAECDRAFEPTAKPFSPNCLDEKFSLATSLCKKNCLTCCRSPKYDCYDDPDSPLDCSKVSCSGSFQDALARFCPSTCGLCDKAPGANSTCMDHSDTCESIKFLCKDEFHGSEVQKLCPLTCGTCIAQPCRRCLKSSIKLTLTGPGAKPFDHDIMDERVLCSTRTLICIGKSAIIEWNGGEGITPGVNGIAIETLLCAADGSGWHIPPETKLIITRAECSVTGPL